MATEKELRDRLKKEKAKVNDKTKSEKIKSLAKKKIKSIEDELAKIGGEVVKDTKKVVTKGKDLAKMTDKEFEKAKDDLAKKLGKSEEECEEIIKKFKEQREKAKRSRKKLQNQGNTTTPKSTEKSAEKTLLDTSEVLGDKIQKQIDGFESEAKRDARKKVKDQNLTTAQKNKKVDELVKNEVRKQTKFIADKMATETKSVIAEISKKLSSIDKQLRLTYLRKVKSEIDAMISKMMFGGLTDGATQNLNVTQSQMSAESVNPQMYAKGGDISDKQYLDNLAEERNKLSREKRANRLENIYNRYANYTTSKGKNKFDVFDKKSEELLEKNNTVFFDDLSDSDIAKLERLVDEIELKDIKGFAKGGRMKQGYNDRMDESLGMRNRGMKSQTFKDRRDEAKGLNKAMGDRAYQSVRSMDKMAKGGQLQDNIDALREIKDIIDYNDEAVKDFEDLLEGNTYYDNDELKRESEMIISKHFGGDEYNENLDNIYMIIDKYYDYGVGIEEWSIITENEEEYFDNEEEAREFWNSLSEKERKSGQYFRKSYFINEDGEFEEDEVEIIEEFAKGGKVKKGNAKMYQTGGGVRKFSKGGYNGWTNYATWVTHLEMMDGLDWNDYNQGEPITKEILEQYVDESLDMSPELARSNADRFLSDVNYYEIAEHINDQYGLSTGEEGSKYAKGGKIISLSSAQKKAERTFQTFGYGMSENDRDMFGVKGGGTYFIMKNGDLYRKIKNNKAELFMTDFQMENGGEIMTADSDIEFASGGLTKNSQIIKQFLTEETNNSVGNISIHYSTLGNVMLLRNYGTLIAKRTLKGNKAVFISKTKYSATTSRIQNMIKNMAESMGMKVIMIDEDEFENGGEIMTADTQFEYKKGGRMKQGYNDRMDESLGMRNRGMKSQTFKDRRDEAKGMNKAMRDRAYQSVGTMDRMKEGGQLFDDLKIKKGAFTKKAKQRGLSTEAFMRKVLANPSRYDERTRKQAQLMKNMM